MITQERLKELLILDESTGVFTWLPRLGTRFTRAGKVAGTPKPRGNIEIKIDGKLEQAHRMVWLYLYGYLPSVDVDHKDGNAANNKPSNLREATRTQNLQNTTIYASNTSGYPGVRWNVPAQKWQARITKDQKTLHLGLYDSAEDAAASYELAKYALHTFNPVMRTG